MELDWIKILGISGIILQTVAGLLFLFDQTLSHLHKSFDALITNTRIWWAIQLTSRFKVRILQLILLAVITTFLYLIIQRTAISPSEELNIFLFILVESNSIDIKEYIFKVLGGDYNHYLYIIFFYLILHTSITPKIITKRRIFSHITTDKSAIYIIILNTLSFLISVLPLITLIILSQIPALASNSYFFYIASLLVFILAGIAILSIFVTLVLLFIRFFISLRPNRFWPIILLMWSIGGILLGITVFNI